MIRDAKNERSVKLTVVTREGVQYNSVDIPSNAWSIPNCVSFWDGNRLMIMEMSKIDTMYLTFSGEEYGV
jgi:hypothetical protein